MMFQKGELFLLRVFSLDRPLGKNYSQRQPQTSCPLMLRHAGNNLPLETSMYLLLLLFGTALCYALYKHGTERGFPRAQNICRRVGTGVVLLHTCCCSTWDIRAESGPTEFHRSEKLSYQDCRLVTLPRHNKKRTVSWWRNMRSTCLVKLVGNVVPSPPKAGWALVCP